MGRGGRCGTGGRGTREGERKDVGGKRCERKWWGGWGRVGARKGPSNKMREHGKHSPRVGGNPVFSCKEQLG